MDDPARTKEYLDISANELQRLGLLVDNVLKISLFEKKEISLVKEPIDLKQLVSEVIGTMGLQFRKYQAQVNLHGADEELIIQGDRLHIMSVIYNLLDNALKYKRENPVIDVKLTRDNDQIVLQVIDNGIGIDPHYRSRIFEKFFRVPVGNNHDVKGYGLGLSYVSHIVEQHKGTITVESEVGKGSTFTIKFPA
jgi:two-component system phosphate regulon sensor histidine kinase PhoR